MAFVSVFRGAPKSGLTTVLARQYPTPLSPVMQTYGKWNSRENAFVSYDALTNGISPMLMAKTAPELFYGAATLASFRILLAQDRSLLVLDRPDAVFGLATVMQECKQSAADTVLISVSNASANNMFMADEVHDVIRRKNSDVSTVRLVKSRRGIPLCPFSGQDIQLGA